MKTKLIIGLLLLGFYSNAQNGYIKFHEDSTLVGYLKYFNSLQDGEQLIEFWETKKDKSPDRYHKGEIIEYAISKDTFRILKYFRPFESEEIHFEVIEAEVVQSGRIELLKIRNPYYRSNYVGGGLAGAAVTISLDLLDKSLENTPVIYVLRESINNYMRGVPEKDKKFNEVIRDFFPEAAIESFEKNNGKVKIRNLKALVQYYNLKTSKKIN